MREESEQAGAAATRFTGRLLAIMIWIISAFGAISVIAAPVVHFTTESAKRAAREAGLPERVAVEAFRRTLQQDIIEEAVLTAQIVPQRLISNPGPTAKWMLPLLATDATSPSAAPIAWLAHSEAAFTGDTLADTVQGRGPAGFIVELSARRVTARKHFAAVTNAAGSYEDSELVFEPYLGDRDAKLAPVPFSWFYWGLFLIAVVASFFYGLKNWRNARAADAWLAKRK